jgi:predicted porin
MTSTLTAGSRATRGSRALKAGIALALLSSVATLAQAQTAAPAADDSLTFHGITLYGLVDLGLQYQTNGAPISDYFPAGSADIVQKNSRQSVFGVTPNNIAQSRIGLQGSEPIYGDISGVFKLETFFNPQSGNISDALKSVTLNNGRTAATSTTNIDSSVAGQLFQQSYLGFSSPTLGTLTFGRQNTVLADGISKYDPNYASQAFSLIGLSGTTAGGGDTQDRRLDDSLKYVLNYNKIFHVAAQYKFNGSNGAANTAFEGSLGGEVAGLSVDAYYVKVRDAVSVSSLSAAQLTAAVTAGFSPDKAVAATISDNTTYALLGNYKVNGEWKLFAGYEHIDYANPSQPLAVGFDDIGGYKLAVVNNAAFPNDKILQVYWAGVRWTAAPGLDLTLAYYGYHQNAYGTGANAGCSTTQSGTCSGTLQDVSFDADYAFTKHFDGYVGAMYSGVKDGLAAGYDFHTTDITTTLGLRYKF